MFYINLVNTKVYTLKLSVIFILAIISLNFSVLRGASNNLEKHENILNINSIPSDSVELLQDVLNYYLAPFSEAMEADLLAMDEGVLLSLVDAYIAVGRFQMEHGNFSLAEQYLQKAYEISVLTDLARTRSVATSNLSTLNFLKGNYKLAFEFLQKHKAISDSLITVGYERSTLIMNMAQEFEKEREVAITRLENKRQILIYQRIGMIIIILALFIFIVLFLFLMRNYRQKKQAVRELKTHRNNLEDIVTTKTLQLILAKDMAEESSRLKSAFLANLSHEIRTPLNGIVGFLKFIDNYAISPVRRQEYIDIIKNCSKQLVKIIDDIIDISKIEAQQMDIYPIALQLNDMMKEIQTFIEIYTQTNNKKHVEIILDDSGFITPSLILGDSNRIKQIICNLLNNAVKFTQKGYVRFGYRLKKDENLLEFFVEDTGIGIQENQLENIFLPFRQTDTGNNRNYEGIGVGLSISRGLAQLMGGDMRVKSKIEEGSTFSFTIAYIPCE